MWGAGLSHVLLKGSPRILEWVADSFSSRPSQPRNRTGVSCFAGGFFTNCFLLHSLFKDKGLVFCTSYLTVLMTGPWVFVTTSKDWPPSSSSLMLLFLNMFLNSSVKGIKQVGGGRTRIFYIPAAAPFDLKTARALRAWSLSSLITTFFNLFHSYSLVQFLPSIENFSSMVFCIMTHDRHPLVRIF